MRAKPADELALRIFGDSGVRGRVALRGLTMLRGLGEQLNPLYGEQIREGTTSFREHVFIRSIEGLFATPVAKDGTVDFEGVTVERGTTYSRAGGDPNRVFELVYCESCGEEFVGGRRGENAGNLGIHVELLPASPELEALPEVGGEGNYEDLSYDDFAVFWPSRRKPKSGDNTQEGWPEAILDTRNGVVSALHELRPRASPPGHGCLHSLLGTASQSGHRSGPRAASPECLGATRGPQFVRIRRRFSAAL